MTNCSTSPFRFHSFFNFTHFVELSTLIITPAAKDGHCGTHVVQMLLSRITGYNAAKAIHAVDVTRTIFDFFTTYHISDGLITNSGSNITPK